MIDTVIVGAGPYGLSLAAHLRDRGLPFRIFGRLMDSWKSHMPKGMLLKSDGFASNIYDPTGEFTLKKFCAQNHIEYHDKNLPVALETFCAYGIAFQERMVPELEDQLVSRMELSHGGFVLQLDNGEVCAARNVILAVGITHFAYTPPVLAQLGSEFVSHSSAHHDLDAFRGLSVTVIGAGSSALDLAGLLHDAGADVRLVARQKALKFHTRGDSAPSLWERIRYPQSGLGPGLRSRFFANWPRSFHRLPEWYRIHAVRTHLGPSGGWFARDKVIGRVPLFLGYTPEQTQMDEGRVRLRLRAQDGGLREIVTDHVIAATGYRVDVDRLKFMDLAMRSKIRTAGNAPVLSSKFESTIPGLYFAGVAAANSFGPVARFAFGAKFTASCISEALTREFSRRRAFASVPNVATTVK
ncbi:MAG TPA: NAD(P)-binding domain-containing protein [Candidatus Cybelea sp.]|nr:NAD(P)-binding domain-containing protein [Candidatus Cybelea sp.]